MSFSFSRRVEEEEACSSDILKGNVPLLSNRLVEKKKLNKSKNFRLRLCEERGRIRKRRKR